MVKKVLFLVLAAMLALLPGCYVDENGMLTEPVTPEQIDELIQNQETILKHYDTRPYWDDKLVINDDSLVLWLPLYRSDYSCNTSSFYSFDYYKHSCSANATWSTLGRVFTNKQTVNCGTDSVYGITSEITLLSWVKFTDFADWRIILSKATSKSGGYKYYIRGNSGGYILMSLAGLSDPTCQTASSIITTNVWYCIAGTYDGSATRIYLNGILKKEEPSTGSIATATGDTLSIGSICDGTFTKGTIGEVAIYSRALSEQEISDYYDLTKWRYGQ